MDRQRMLRDPQLLLEGATCVTRDQRSCEDIRVNSSTVKSRHTLYNSEANSLKRPKMEK